MTKMAISTRVVIGHLRTSLVQLSNSKKLVSSSEVVYNVAQRPMSELLARIQLIFVNVSQPYTIAAFTQWRWPAIECCGRLCTDALKERRQRDTGLPMPSTKIKK